MKMKQAAELYNLDAIQGATENAAINAVNADAPAFLIEGLHQAAQAVSVLRHYEGELSDAGAIELLECVTDLSLTFTAVLRAKRDELPENVMDACTEFFRSYSGLMALLKLAEKERDGDDSTEK